MCNGFPTNSGDSYGHKLRAPLIAEGFMSNLQKSERFDLIDKFNDTSR